MASTVQYLVISKYYAVQSEMLAGWCEKENLTVLEYRVYCVRMRNDIVVIPLDNLNQLNIHRMDNETVPRLYAVVKIIDGEPRITEVERKDDRYSFYLTQDDCNIIWENWVEMQERRQIDGME